MAASKGFLAHIKIGELLQALEPVNAEVGYGRLRQLLAEDVTLRFEGDSGGPDEGREDVCNRLIAWTNGRKPYVARRETRGDRGFCQFHWGDDPRLMGEAEIELSAGLISRITIRS